MKLTAKHTIDASPKDFFEKIFFSREFNEALYREGLKMKGFDIEALEDLGDAGRRKRVRVTPKQEAPGFVKKVIRGELSYVEDGTWSRSTGVYTFTTVTSVASDRIRIAGTVEVEPLGEDRCERTVEMTIVVKVPIVGGQLERFVGEQLKSSFGKGAEFTNRWIAEQIRGVSPS